MAKKVGRDRYEHGYCDQITKLFTFACIQNTGHRVSQLSYKRKSLFWLTEFVHKVVLSLYFFCSFRKKPFSNMSYAFPYILKTK